MFYEQAEVDSYIVENLYGGVGENLPDYTQRYAGLKYFDVEQLTYLAPVRQKANSSDSQKLTPFECYIALIKGYCVILVLILPRSFASGGFVCTAVLVAISGIISALCAKLLV